MKILMIGSDPDGYGGMSSVASVILRNSADFADIRYVSTYCDGPAALRIRVWITGWLRVAVLLLTDRPDVLHAHVSERSSVLRKGVMVLLARLLGVPSVLHCHGGFLFDWLEHMPKFVRIAVRTVFRSASAVGVLSSYWRERYIAEFGLAEENVRVLGNPVVVPVEPPVRESGGELGVLFLGRFGANKGSANVLRAVAEVRSEIPIRLRMAGDGEVNDTRVLAESLETRAEISGYVGQHERDNLLAGNDVLVLPSRAEVLPMAVLEAMGYGLVPVVSPVGALPEIITDRINGLFVPPDDVPAIAAALRELAADPELRAKLSAAARSAVAPFEATNYLKGLLRLWESVLAKHE